MKIRNFESTLSFAKATLNEDRAEDNVHFERNFDSIMEQAASYIRSVVGERKEDNPLNVEELNSLIIEDYSRLVDETYQNTDIPILSMKYIAIKYLTKNRNEIPDLLKEIEERGLVYSENESYTDDFHENLLISLLDLQEDYKEYSENMKETNPEFCEEIEALIAEHGKIGAFKKYCEKYSNVKGISYTARRQILSYGYLSIFGIEGLDESAVSEKSPVMKYKNSNFLKDYINGYLERLEPVYRENLEKSIITRFSQLDRFGEIAEDIDKHNEKMRRIRLPGLGYSAGDTITLPSGTTLPNIRELMNKDTLSKLDIDVLLRMNSFYNNRLAKVINDYAMAVFVMDNLGCAMDCYEGNPPTKASISEDTLEQLLIKYKTLILPIKAFFAKTQKDIDENPDNYDANVQKIETEDESLGEKEQVLLDLDEFIDDVKKSWKKSYETHFDQTLPKVSNDLKQDIILTNILYNPVFLSYRFKNMALKSEYAYLHFLSETQKSKSLNYGIVLKNDNDWDARNILLASDGGVNLPNRLHTIKREFVDFLIAYTGTPLVRIYEGFEDFSIGKEYVSSKILLPNSKQHAKYLKDLKRGKLEEKGDNISKITPGNEDFISHTEYCMDSTHFMPKYQTEVSKVDKKGKATIEKKQLVRYIDLTNGKIYTLRDDGKLVDKDGLAYGETSEEIRGRDE